MCDELAETAPEGLLAEAGVAGDGHTAAGALVRGSGRARAGHERLEDGEAVEDALEFGVGDAVCAVVSISISVAIGAVAAGG